MQRPIKLSGTPPSREDVQGIFRLKPGESAAGTNALKKRMQKSCFLDAKNRRFSRFERLQEQYRRDGLTLFLGAGVSRCSGVRDWKDLLDDLLSSVRPDKGDSGKLSSSLLSEKANLSLPAQFSLVREHLGSEGDFVRSLFSHLYGSEKFKETKALVERIPVSDEQKIASKTKPLWRDLATKIETENPTLASIGKLLLADCARCDDGKPECNPKIHGVLTTNVDNLLQNYVMALADGHRLLNTVDRPSVGDHPKMISVFHLHGFLDARSAMEKEGTAEVANGDEEPEPPRLVFQEGQYFDVIARPTGFANYTAHSFLQRTNVLFVGTSLDDVNVRRWLYTSYRERVDARAEYLKLIYEEEYKDASEEAEIVSLRHFWLRSKTGLGTLNSESGQVQTTAIDGHVERLTHNLGIEIIWYNEHSEVAAHLSALKEG